MKRKILVLASTFPRWEGDSEPRFVLDLSSRFVDEFEVAVVAPGFKGAKEKEYLEGVKVYRFNYGERFWGDLAYEGGMISQLKRKPWKILFMPFFLFSFFICACKVIRDDNVKLIHAHWIVPQGFIGVLLKVAFWRRDIKLLVTAHGADVYSLSGVFWDVIRKWVLRRSDSVTVVSDSMKQHIVDSFGLVRESVHVASMGVDTENKFFPCKENSSQRKDLLFVGRLVEKKGVVHLLNAFSMLLKERSGFSLKIVGDGPLKSELLKLTRELELENDVFFIGAQEHSMLPKVYREALLSVFPFVVAKDGDQEGLGLVVVEAMACGCPVIATDLPALNDTMNGVRSSWRVLPEDPLSLKNRIGSFLDLEDHEVKELIDRNREFAVKKYSWTAVSKRYIDIIEELDN